MTNRKVIRIGERDVVLQGKDIRSALSRVPVLMPDECWAWGGPRRTDGYGRHHVMHEGAVVAIGAHRLVYTLLVDDIPDGFVPDHLCRNRICVNPSHLDIVTPAENSRRGAAHAREARTHCRRGHEYTAQSTRITSDGTRFCRVCYKEVGRARNRNYYRSNKEAYKKRDDMYWARRLGIDVGPDCGVVTKYGTVCGRPEGHDGRHYPKRKTV